MKKKILYLASKNQGKINEYKKMLSTINCKLLLQPDSIEIIENGRDFRENAAKKACEVAIKTKNYTIADDSGLCIEALNGMPGIFSSRYAADDESRIKRVLDELNGVNNRKAFFVANLCLASPLGEPLHQVQAKCYGNILLKPRGSNGFGYDPIFEEITSRKTFAEMKENLKERISHRGKAINKLIPNLLDIFSDI